MTSLLALITGLSAGILVGSALCAFYIALGIFSKLSLLSGLGKSSLGFVLSAIFGIIFGTIISIFDVSIKTFRILPIIMGFAGGAFIGIYIACLAEVVNIMPVLKNNKIATGTIVFLLFIFALGKAIGSLIYWFDPAFS